MVGSWCFQYSEMAMLNSRYLAAHKQWCQQKQLAPQQDMRRDGAHRLLRDHAIGDDILVAIAALAAPATKRVGVDIRQQLSCGPNRRSLFFSGTGPKTLLRSKLRVGAYRPAPIGHSRRSHRRQTRGRGTTPAGKRVGTWPDACHSELMPTTTNNSQHQT